MAVHCFLLNNCPWIYCTFSFIWYIFLQCIQLRQVSNKIKFWMILWFFPTLKWSALHILDKINKGVCCARSVIIYHVTIILSYSQVPRKTVIFYSILCSLWMFAISIIYKTKKCYRQILWFSLSYRYFNIWNGTESKQIPSCWQCP